MDSIEDTWSFSSKIPITSSGGFVIYKSTYPKITSLQCIHLQNIQACLP